MKKPGLGETDVERRSQVAATLGALLMIVAPLSWAWQLERLSAANIAASGDNPPVEGRAARRAIKIALGSGYAPSNELPEVRLVNNPANLASLQIAQQGDLILVYRQKGLLLLYDPLTGRILNRASFRSGLSAY